MSSDREVTEIALPVAEAAELTMRAAAVGMPLAEYLGVLALAAAYGLLHPWVLAFRARPGVGCCGTKIKDREA